MATRRVNKHISSHLSQFTCGGDCRVPSVSMNLPSHIISACYFNTGFSRSNGEQGLCFAIAGKRGWRQPHCRCDSQSTRPSSIQWAPIFAKVHGNRLLEGASRYRCVTVAIIIVPGPNHVLIFPLHRACAYKNTVLTSLHSLHPMCSLFK